MLPRKYRLKEGWRIKKVLQSKNRKYCDFFILKWERNKLSYSQFAFLASKKLGKAVIRNRASRLLRESVRETLEYFPEGVDIIFIARSGILNKKPVEIKEKIRDELKFIKL